MNLLDLKIKKVAKKVITSSIKSWEESDSLYPVISKADFELALGIKKTDQQFGKRHKLIGLYLIEKKFISGDFTAGTWSVSGFIVSSAAVEWVREGFYDKYRDLCNIALGSLLALLGTALLSSFRSESIMLSKNFLNPIKSEVTLHTTNMFKQYELRSKKIIRDAVEVNTSEIELSKKLSPFIISRIDSSSDFTKCTAYVDKKIEEIKRQNNDETLSPNTSLRP